VAGDQGVKFIEYPDRDMMMIDLASKIAGELGSALRGNDHASLCVPGGTTPGPMFDALCAADVEWERVHIFLGDERWVPETSERSNTRLVRERLMVNRAAAARLVPLHLEGMGLEEAIPRLTEALEPELPISVLLLGMGTDGHTASLFPGADRLDEAMASDAPPLMAITAPGAQDPRLTLTLPVLQGAMSIHVLIVGPEKREALERVRNLKPAEAPVAAILPEATVHWAE
jgi:6-phosphogluconolactonase